jgi:hypothetical protein
MPEPPDGPPKIIIDDDWKAQAQREKERLAAKEREAAAKKKPEPASATAAQPAAPGAEGQESETAPSEFQALVGTLVTQALLYLGGIPDPQTGRAMVSLEHAQFHIALLEVLDEKTKGNLTPDEQNELSMAINELKNRFVEISRAVMQMQAKRAAGGGAGGPGGPGGPGGEGPAAIPNLRLRHD